ncbi:MAG: IgA Peptidase M64 [Tannerella sp.]|nr:IgA Peptidase M64 [Tannerella sp.]
MPVGLWMTALLTLCCPALPAQDDFDAWFERKSLRIDFTLSGNKTCRSAALEQLREEPVWAGPLKNRTDPFEYGDYYIKVYAPGRQLIYSRGFNTLFEEWRTTDEAALQTRSWSNSISVPWPRQRVRIELSARERSTNRFAPLLEWEVDPQSITIDRSPLKPLKTVDIQRKGDPAGKVDLVFLPEGYTEAEMEKFDADARRFADALFRTPPYDRRQDDFNVCAVHLPSEESGADLPGRNVYRHTALHVGFYTFGIDRYLTTRDMKSVRDAVWNVPCDAVFILVNSDLYGGGGIYNFYAIGTADHERTLRVFVHELGHSFAGLADEYFQSAVAYSDFYNLEVEPWEPNITTLVDFDGKWKDLLPADTPVPTPLKAPFADRVGVFEGGGYLAKGIYRPMDHCTMRDMAGFCPVCQRAILKMIDFMTDKRGQDVSD